MGFWGARGYYPIRKWLEFDFSHVNGQAKAFHAIERLKN